MLRSELFTVAALVGFALFPTGPLSVLAVTCVILHFVGGVPRWQMAGMYMAALVVTIGLVADLVLPQTNRNWTARPQSYQSELTQWGPFTLSALPWIVIPLVLISVVCDICFGLGVMIAPSGRHPVASVVEHVEGSGGVTFNLRLYYPCETTGAARRSAKLQPYFRHGTASGRAIARYAGLPKFVFDHLAHVRHSVFARRRLAECNSVPPSPSVDSNGSTPFRTPASGESGAEEAYRLPKQLPLVIFSHGLGGTPDVYLANMQDLASHGFLVAAVEHNDGSAAITVLPGDVTRLYEPLTPEEKKDDSLSFRKRNGQLHRRACEVLAAIDHIIRASEGKAHKIDGGSEEWDANPLQRVVKGRVDAKRIGVMGHSFGAATALVAASRDPRISACVALDPWLLPVTRSVLCGVGPYDETVSLPDTAKSLLPGKPVLTLFGEEFTTWKHTVAGIRSLLYHNNLTALEAVHTVLPKITGVDAGNVNATPSKDAGEVHPSTAIYTLKGAEHQNFCDFPLFGKIIMRAMKTIGPIDPVVAIRVVTTLALSHFHDAFASVEKPTSKKSSGYYIPFEERQKMSKAAQTYAAAHCKLWPPLSLPDTLAIVKK